MTHDDWINLLIAGAILLLVVLWRFYLAKEKADWIKTFAINVWTVCVVITVFVVGLFVLDSWDWWRPSMTTSALITAAAIPLFALVWRLYAARNKIDWIKFALSFGVSVTAIVLLFAVGLLALDIWNQWRLRRDFDSIIYSSDNGLCSVHPSGGSPPYCPGLPYYEPDLSADGQFFVALLGSTGKKPPFTSLVVANRRGFMVEPLVNSNGFGNPVWTPDRRYIFATDNYERHTIGRWSWPMGEKAIVPVHGLDTNCIRIKRIALSPAGGRAAILCDFLRVYIAELQDTGIRILRMLPLSFFSISGLKWFDEGRLFAVARRSEGVPASLWQIDVESGAALSVPTPGLSLESDVALSPDRSAVVARATPEGAWEWALWRIDLADSKTTRLTDGNDSDPTWSK